jgi:hypothetical protein
MILFMKRGQTMAEAVSVVTNNDIIRIEGKNSLTIRVGGYKLTLKIEGPEAKPSGRLQLGEGRTMFDLVLDAARAFIKETGRHEFGAADLYHRAKTRNPELDIRRNSWNSHVMSSTPNHPSYRYYTSHRDYFRYLGRGRYSLNPGFLPGTRETGA